MSGYRVAMIIMERGERVPLLLDADGIPLIRPTEWLLTDRRPGCPAAKTLQANCYALKLLYLWSDAYGVDVDLPCVEEERHRPLRRLPHRPPDPGGVGRSGTSQVTTPGAFWRMRPWSHPALRKGFRFSPIRRIGLLPCRRWN